MKARLRILVAATVLFAGIQGAQAADIVLGFDDLPGMTGSTCEFFSSAYNGFSFGDVGAGCKGNDWFWGVDASPFISKSPTVSVSTDFNLYDPNNYAEDSSAIVTPGDIAFVGAWFSGFEANGDGSPARVQFKLYDNGVLVHTSSFSAQLSATPSFLGTGYLGPVDEIVVVGPQGYYAMDDFTYNTSPIPEPGTYLLMLGGLALVGAASRRQMRR